MASTHARAPAFAAQVTLLAGALLTGAAWAQEIKVNVERRGERIVVDLSGQVAAPLPEAWAVLVDYEHMPAFITSLKTSAVLRRDGNQWEVSQSGETKFGMFKFAFASVRRVELLPQREVRSHLVSGDFNFFESTMRLGEEGGHTTMVYHGEYVPKSWIPPLVGPSMIAGETKRHYTQLFAEILRRHVAAQAGSAPPAPRASAPM